MTASPAGRKAPGVGAPAAAGSHRMAAEPQESGRGREPATDRGCKAWDLRRGWASGFCLLRERIERVTRRL